MFETKNLPEMVKRVSRIAENARFVASSYSEEGELDHPGEQEGWLQHARDMEELAQWLADLYKRETGLAIPLSVAEEPSTR